jgi:hypothetical protein
MSAYETDIVLWSAHQADLLRRRASGVLINDAELDWSNIAEEIDSLGRSHARELGSRLATILVHLMKLQASPACTSRAGWRDTILEQRDEIGRARRRVIAALAAHGEDPLIDLATATYTPEQVCGTWLPA